MRTKKVPLLADPPLKEVQGVQNKVGDMAGEEGNMFSYSGRSPGLSGVIPSAGGVPRGQPPPPRQEKAHPRGIRRHWTSGIDGLESGLLDRLFGQIPASAQLALLCA